MFTFDVVEAGYNAADETINFGTRNLGDGDNLYEACTFATLTCSEEAEQGNGDAEEPSTPHITAMVQRGSVYFSVDSLMRVFKDTEYLDILFCSDFNSVVDTFCLTTDGRLLIVALRNGKINVVDCENEFSCIFSHVCETNNPGSKFFVASFIDKNCFYVVAEDGQIYGMKLEMPFEVQNIFRLNCQAAQTASLHYPMLLVQSTKLILLNLESKACLNCAGYQFKKILSVRHMFVALDFEGHLSYICPFTFTIFPVEDATTYKDIQLIREPNKMHFLTVTETESQQHLQLLSYPKFSVVSSLKVSNEIHLISLDSATDEMLYILKVSSRGSVKELRFQMSYQTDPTERLHRLLKRRRFDEAERFAQVFNLDRGLVVKARAQEITEKAQCTSEDIVNLMRILEMVKEDSFKLQCCLDVALDCSSLNDVRTILMFGCQLKLQKGEGRTEATDLQKNVSSLMFRFDSFIALDSISNRTAETWLWFAECDLLEELNLLLRCSRINEASVIYARLDEATKNQLTENHIFTILNHLKSLPDAVFEPFLPTFFSVTLSILPSTLPLFIRWTHDRVFALEKRATASFPQNAIGLTLRMLKMMEGGLALVQSARRLHTENLEQLHQLLAGLRMLQTLKDEYNVSIPVEEYLKGPQNVVRLLLAVQRSPAEYSLFLKKFVWKFMMENHMDVNETFLGALENLMEYGDSYWIAFLDCILDRINSIDDKLKAVKMVAEKTAVPWCDTLRNILHRLKDYPEIANLIKNEPVSIVLKRPVYQIREICDEEGLETICNRIIYCGEPTMVEDVGILCDTKEKRRLRNVLLITHFIRKGRLEEATSVLDDNTPKEILECCEYFANFIEHSINKNFRWAENCYLIADSIFQRLNDNTSDGVEEFVHAARLNAIKVVFKLRQKYNIIVTTGQMNRKENREKIQAQIFESLSNRTDSVEEISRHCRNIASCLNLPYDDVLLSFCQHAADCDVFVKVAQLLLNSDSCRNLRTMACLLVKHLGLHNELSHSSVDMNNSLILDEKLTAGNEVPIETLRLARSLIARAIAKSRDDEVLDCIEVSRWIDTSFYFARGTNSNLKTLLFGDIHYTGSIPPGCLTFSAIRNLFVALCNYQNGRTPELELSSAGEDDFVKEMELLPSVVEQMSDEGQHFTAYKIVLTLQNSVMQNSKPNLKILGTLNGLLNTRCIPNVVSCVMNNKIVDVDFLYNLLLSYNRENGIGLMMTMLRKYKINPDKFEAVARLGLRFFEFHGVSKGKPEMMKNLMTIKWWRKFESRKFDYVHFFKITAHERWELLVNADCLDKSSSKEYCRDFQLESQYFSKCFLKKTLTNWRPDYEIAGGSLIVRSSESDLVLKCKELIEDITDVPQVLTIMRGIWHTVNPYCHEVFMAMLKITAELDPEDNDVERTRALALLKGYRRVSKPGEVEIEAWYSVFPDTTSLDVLSEFRLPFSGLLFTKQICDVIMPEINLKTYKVWLTTYDIFPHLNKDELCSVAIKNTSVSRTDDGAQEWVLHSMNEDLFEEIDECVRNFSNLERATSALYHLMRHIPEGADQVAAAKLCYKYALRYEEQNPNDAAVKIAVTKVEKKYFACCGMHILHLYQLTDKKYIDLLTRPQDLILALYSDERIVTLRSCPAIHKAADKLALLFDLNISQIRLSLVQAWLGKAESESTMSYVLQDDGNNLIRASYVCSLDASFWQLNLLSLGLDQEQERTNLPCRVNALRVASMISSRENIAAMAGRSYDDFQTFVDKLNIVSNLQRLGFNVEVGALDQCNKQELITRLVQNADNPLAVKTLALYCTAYKISDVKCWEFVVDKCVGLGLFEELEGYLSYLNQGKFLYKKFYLDAWQRWFGHLFLNLSDGPGLEEVLVKNFMAIQLCPVAFHLNFSDMFTKCLQLDKAEFAAVLLQYFDSDTRGKYVEEVRKKERDLNGLLNNLAQKGLWDISYVKSLLER